MAKNVFFWELIDGKWVAIFSKSHEQGILDRFTSRIESVAGRKIFAELSVSSSLVSAKFPTNFRDGELLIDALTDFGVQPLPERKRLYCL